MNQAVSPKRAHRSAAIWIVAALAAVLPVALLGWYSLQVTENSLNTLIESNNRSDANTASELLKAFVNADFGLLRTAASFPTLSASIRVHDVANTRERLKSIVSQNPTVDRVLVLDADGAVWCEWPEAPGASGQSRKSTDYFHAAMASRDVYLSPVFADADSPQDLRVAVALPIIESDQQVRRVLVLEHRLDSVTGWVSHLSGQGGSFVVILDQNRMVVGHPTLKLAASPYGGYAALPDLQNATTDVPHGADYVDPVTHREVIGSVKAVDLAAGSRWLVLAEQDKEQAYAPSRELRLHIALAAGFVASLAIVAAVALARASERTRQLAVGLAQRNTALQEAMAQQKKVQEELDKERYFFQMLMNNVPERIYFKDKHSRFIAVNHAMAELFKLSDARDVIGKSDFDFFPPDEANRSLEDEQQVMTTGEAIIGRIKKKVMPDGRSYWVSNTKAPLKDVAGQIVGTFGISHDVTRLMTVEYELRQANAAMEKQNEDLRAAHAAEVKVLAELREAQGQLVQSAKLAGLGQMVAGVAHEINNPLAFVSNNVVVLERDIAGLRRILDCYRQADPLIQREQSELYQQLQSVAEEIDLTYVLENLNRVFDRSTQGLKRIAEIVQGLRTFARTDDGALCLEPNFNAGVESTLVIARGRAARKRVRLEFTAGEMPPLVCNMAKLNQVILNLVTNAIDASREDSVVSVRTSADEKSACVEVSDQGCGIEPEARSKLFEPFYTTKPIGQGVGLGLSISYGIVVKEHRGTIDVDSTPGQGTKFTIRIPRGLPKGKS
jgi:PAS domain S-box-containing protein